MTTIRKLRPSRENPDNARRPAPRPPDCERAASTHALTPRVEDLGAWWSPRAHRALAMLPPELQWARPLLDPLRPVALLCSREQARRVLAWHAQLPNQAQVSFTVARRRPDDDRPPLCA